MFYGAHNPWFMVSKADNSQNVKSFHQWDKIINLIAHINEISLLPGELTTFMCIKAYFIAHIMCWIIKSQNDMGLFSQSSPQSNSLFALQACEKSGSNKSTETLMQRSNSWC